MSVKGAENKIGCCGCRACEEICPKKCISMVNDREGFDYPEINTTQCIKCNLCDQVCPMQNQAFYPADEINVFIGKCKDNQVISASSSGGAFTLIYEKMIAAGYLIYGVKFNDELHVIHDCASTVEECAAFRKSKYIQSNTNGCYSRITDDLTRGKKVLFSGTPCQCQALQNFLKLKKVSTEHLIIISVLCHGVPGQTLFDIYRNEQEEIHKSKLKAFVFRSKEPINGEVNSRSAILQFASGEKKLVDLKSDPFLKAYYLRLFIRQSCGECPFARLERNADITLGDAWQIEKKYPQWQSKEGVSLIFSGTDKGRSIIFDLSERMLFKSVTLDWAKSVQDVLNKPTEMHQYRDRFFNLLSQKGFSYAVNKATHRTIIQRSIRKMCKILGLK